MGELKKGKRAKQPTPAFITSTLQQEASRRLGFTATRTMRDVYKRQRVKKAATACAALALRGKDPGAIPCTASS